MAFEALEGGALQDRDDLRVPSSVDATQSVMLPHLKELHSRLTISQADLQFRHRVFAINLEREKLKASIEDHTSVRHQALYCDPYSLGRRRNGSLP